MHKVVRREAATDYPVTLDELKSHLKVIDDDDYLTTLLATSTSMIERYLNRSLCTQEWTLYLDEWCYKILLPYSSIQSVESVKYYDLNGDPQTLTELDYYHVVTSDDPGYIQQRYDVTYPELEEGKPDAIEIEYTAGYGDPEDVPAEIKHAIKLICTDLHEHRGELVTGSVNRIPNYVNSLCHSYKLYQF